MTAAHGQLLQDFAIDHIEFVQVVQNHDNTVPLIASKSTVARVFLRSSVSVPVTSGISGALTADGYSETLHVFGRLPAIAPVGTPDPDNPQHSLNFHLPPSWTNPLGGTLHVHATATLNGSAQKTLSANAVFQSSMPLVFRVFHVEVCAPDSQGNRQCPPKFDDVSEQLQKVYPLADGVVEYTPLATSTIEWPAPLGFSPDDSDDAKAAARLQQVRFTKFLKTLYYLLEGSYADRLFAWLPAVGGTGGGQGNASWAPASCLSDPCSAADVQALGVTLADSLAFNQMGASGARVGPGAFDPKTETVIPSASVDLSSGGAWPSASTYTKLFNGLLVFPVVTKPFPRNESLIIGGTVTPDGSVATLEPGYRIYSAGSEPSDPAGSHCLRFSGGDTVDYCFTPFYVDGIGGFAVKAPIPSGTTRVALIRHDPAAGDTELTALIAAANAPTVNIMLPQAGDAWQDSGTIQWTGDDGLVYAVEYSPDNGGSWIPLTIDLTDTQYQVDATRLSGSPQVLIRVLASNGLLTTAAVVGPINVMQTPKLALDQSTLSFPNVTVGQVADVTLLLSNTGTGPLTASGLISGGPFSIVTGGGNLMIPAGGQRAMTVRFAPTSSGQQINTLALSSTDPSLASVNIGLMGTGFNNPVPSISVSAAAIDFGSVNFGQTKDATFTITNAGSGPLTVNSISGISSRFRIVAPSLPVAIAAGMAADVTVRFAPDAAGPLSGTLSIASSDPTRGTFTIAVTGTGVGGPPPAPAVSVTSRSLDFGSLITGQSVDSKFTIANTGATDVVVRSITGGAGVFSILSPSGQFTVAAGKSTDVIVRFTPAAAGAFSTALTISFADGSSLMVSVSGSATAPVVNSVLRTITYNEVTALTTQAMDTYNLPAMSRSGNRAIFTVNITDLWTVNTDGSGLRKIDTYQDYHYLGISDDGSKALIWGPRYLRIVNTDGSDARTLLTDTDDQAIIQARLSGDGKTVFFVNSKDSMLTMGTFKTRTERGIWTINSDGTNLHEVIGSPAIAGALLIKDSDIAGMVNDLPFPGAFDVSTTGSHIVFGVETSTPQGRILMAINGDSTALHKLRGGLANLYTAAISPDGYTIAYTAAPSAGASGELDVIHYDVSGPLTISSKFGTFALQVSSDGSQILVMDSGKGDVWRSDGSGLIELFPPPFGNVGQLAAENDDFLRVSMAGDGRRFLFTIPDNGLLQFAMAEINPANLGGAPAIGNVTITPGSVVADGQTNSVTITTIVTSVTPPAIVNAEVFLQGLYDRAGTVLSSTGGGVYTGSLSLASTVAGPRTIRIKAETQDPDVGTPAVRGKHHATAIDVGGFVITAPAR